MTLKLNHILGFASIVIGALATFDNGMIPVVRYLLIYFSLLTVIGVIVYSIYIDVNDTPTLEKIKDEL